MGLAESAANYAALAALTDAVSGEKNKASAELRVALGEVGLMKGTIDTPFGALTLRENKGGTSVTVDDEDALVGWAETNHPDALEHITRLRAADREQILTTRFAAVAGKVVDTLTGEVVPFAHVEEREASPPTPSYGASERQREVKRIAAVVAADRAAGLVDSLHGSLQLEAGSA